jgi:hypothetical protein
MEAMKTLLLPLALSLSVPAFAGSSVLEALRAEAGAVEAIQIPVVAARQTAAASVSDIPVLGATLVYRAGRAVYCYDGSDPLVHGAPMCSVALSNDPSEQHYIYSSLGSRERGGNTVVKRERKLFAIGKSGLGGFFTHWAVESRDLVLDPSGAVVSATVTTPEVCASEQACSGRAIQPYQVRDGSGPEKTVLIGRVSAPMTAAQIVEELEKSLAALHAK